MNNTGNAILIVGLIWLGNVYGWSPELTLGIIYGFVTWLIPAFTDDRRRFYEELPGLLREIGYTLRDIRSFLKEAGGGLPNLEG